VKFKEEFRGRGEKIRKAIRKVFLAVLAMVLSSLWISTAVAQEDDPEIEYAEVTEPDTSKSDITGEHGTVGYGVCRGLDSSAGLTILWFQAGCTGRLHFREGL
jgi:hypothetical protein